MDSYVIAESVIPFSQKTEIYLSYNLCKNEENYINRLKATKFYGIGAYDIQNPKYLFKALDSGCIPIYIRQQGDERVWKWLCSRLKLVELLDKEKGGYFMELLVNNPDKGDRYAHGIYQPWIAESKQVKEFTY